jgi:hypothetical protein
MPILNDIELNIVQLIGTMCTSNGYNYNWSTDSINEEDVVIGSFPRAVINPSDSLFDKETCIDTVSGLGTQTYTNRTYYTILVKGELPEFDSNPNFAIRQYLRLALDDLKKLFGKNYNVNGTCANFLYQASQGEYLRRNDILRPAQLRTTWLAIYAQDRLDPTQYAGS